MEALLVDFGRHPSAGLLQQHGGGREGHGRHQGPGGLWAFQVGGRGLTVGPEEGGASPHSSGLARSKKASRTRQTNLGTEGNKGKEPGKAKKNKGHTPAASSRLFPPPLKEATALPPRLQGADIMIIIKYQKLYIRV